MNMEQLSDRAPLLCAAILAAAVLLPSSYSFAQTFVEAERFEEVDAFREDERSRARPDETRIEENEERQQHDRARLDDSQDPASDEATVHPDEAAAREQRERGVNWDRTSKNAREITEGVPVGRIDLDKVKENTAEALGRPK